MLQAGLGGEMEVLGKPLHSMLPCSALDRSFFCIHLAIEF